MKPGRGAMAMLAAGPLALVLAAAGCGGSGSGTPSCQAQLLAGDLVITEIMANPQDRDEGKEWFEIYNRTDADISLGGYTLTDDLDDPGKHELSSDLVVPAGGFLLLWADDDRDAGPAHLGFSLAKSGEDIGIFRDSGQAVNKLTYGAQATDWSAARMPDGALGSDAWVLDTTPSPGERNGEPEQEPPHGR